MQRYFVDNFNNLITGDDANHIFKVMRMKENDQIYVCCLNECYICKITEVNHNLIKYEMLEKEASIAFPKITLFQGMPKYQKVDDIIKYSTIYGVSKIVFTQMHRSEAKVKQISQKLDRLNKISKEASKLAHRQYVPKIDFNLNLSKTDFSSFDLVLFADELEKNNINNQYPLNNLNENSNVAIIIGPEGGFTNEERLYLLSQKAYKIGLGPYILPTESANLYLLAVISAKIQGYF